MARLFPAVVLALSTMPAITIAQSFEQTLEERDQEFLVEVLRTGDTELALAAVAANRAEHAAVRSYARLILEERGRIQRSLTRFSQAHELPATEPERKRPDLLKMRGDDVDQAFVAAAVEAGDAEMKLFTAALTRVENPSLRSFSADALPYVKKHLEAGRRIQESLMSGGTGAISSNAPVASTPPPVTPVTTGQDARQPPKPAP